MKRTQPILEISGLRIQRGRTVILDNVSWRVERGQHWVILGAPPVQAIDTNFMN